jgi:hypothetical protein
MGLQVERLETRRALHAMLASLGDDGCVSAIAPKHGCATTGRREVSDEYAESNERRRARGRVDNSAAACHGL